MNERKQHWETIYREKSPQEVSWYQKEPVLSLALIQQCHIDTEAYIIDVGGGVSTLVDYLLADEYKNIMVLDIAANSLQVSKQRLGSRADEVLWLISDITEFSPPVQVGLWHDRAVFHFLTEPSDRSRYRAVLNKTLMPGGFVIIAAFAPDGPTQCSGLDIVRYDAEKLMTEFGDGYRLLEQQSETHMTPGNRQQQFIYYRLQKL